MRTFFIELAQIKARAVLHRYGVRAAHHIRLEDFAADLGAKIEYAALDGANAQLVRVDDRAKILVTTRVTDIGALRFGIAHELGHFVLEHPRSEISDLCKPRRSVRRNGAKRDYEAEADAFAAELLMPTALVASCCDRTPVRLDIAREIERVYNVSILAAAIRLAELSPAPCAAVFSSNDKVEWFAPSKTFPFEIERDTPLDADSLAHAFFATGELERLPQRMRATAWLPRSRFSQIEEHAICSRAHGTVLSMLWLPEPTTPWECAVRSGSAQIVRIRHHRRAR